MTRPLVGCSWPRFIISHLCAYEQDKLGDWSQILKDDAVWKVWEVLEGGGGEWV